MGMSFLPSPEEAVPYPGSPRFFKRMYDTTGIPFVQEIEDLRYVTPQMNIVIYGYSCRSNFQEDFDKEDQVWGRRQAFPSVCFSEVVPEGEYGFTPLGEAEEISEGEFKEAQAKGWK